jgi:hypothetical protein
MRAVFLAAAELVDRGWTVCPTSRNAAGADLLVTNESCKRVYSIQVKSNAGGANFWLVGQRAMKLSSPTHIYIFVNGAGGSQQEYYVVPSTVVKRRVREDKGGFFFFTRDDAEKYKDNWQLLHKR